MTGEIAAIISTAVTGVFAVIVALIEARESRLSMDMMYASMGLAMDTARALRNGHTNGTLEPDLDKAQAARAAYDAFLRDEAAAAMGRLRGAA